MDEAAIRAKAIYLASRGSVVTRRKHIEAALTEVANAEWDAAKEAAVKACATCHSYQDKGVSACIQAVSRLKRSKR